MTRNFPQTMLRLEQIETDPANVFRHDDGDIQRLVGVVQEYGFLATVTVDAESAHTVDGVKRYRLVGGEARLESARLAGLTEIPATLATFESEQHRTAAAVALNGHFGHFDDDALRKTLETLNASGFDLDMTGLKPHELDDLLSSLNTGQTDPDDVPELPAEPVTQRGDLITLGRHRLLCGDSTDVADVEALMNGEKADLVWTDPPYGVNYTGGMKPQEALLNDHIGTEIYGAALPHLRLAAADHAALYLWYADAHAAAAAAAEAGYSITAQIIWVKNNAQFVTSAHYKGKHEPCFYAHRKGKSAAWYGPKNEVTVWEADRANSNDFHPTQKPVSLAERAIVNSTKHGDIVLDLFGGGGTCLVAAEQTGRTAYLMEIAPKYCDVIISRYEAFTGTQAIRPERVAA